jgi:hypothetical protein
MSINRFFAPLVLLALAILPACRKGATFSRIPASQERRMARIAAETSGKPAPRTGGIMFPQQVGREIRAQAIRPPTPGPMQPPPPGT